MFLYLTQMDPVPASICQTLAAKGWCVKHLPFRQVVFLEPAVDLTGFDLIIISSKQAARWLAARRQAALPVAAVGKATSNLLVDHPLVFGDNPPANAAELMRRLKNDLDPKKRYLFLRGRKASETIPQGFLNYQLTEKIVYRTDKLLKKFPPLEENAMVYFQAPSSVRDYAAAYMRPPKRIGAIGPTTANALHELGWIIDFQPSRPETHHFAAEIPGPDKL